MGLLMMMLSLSNNRFDMILSFITWGLGISLYYLMFNCEAFGLWVLLREVGVGFNIIWASWGYLCVSNNCQIV